MVTIRYVFSCLFLIAFLFLFLEEGPFTYTTHDYSSLIPPDVLIEDAWYGVYFQDSFLGYSHFFMRIKDVEDGGGYVLKNDAHLKFPVLGKLEPFDLAMDAQLQSNYSLESGEFSVQSQRYFFTATLQKKGHDTYALTVETPAEKTTRTVTRKKEIFNLLFSPLSLNYIPHKKKISYAFYDPFLDRRTTVVLQNRGMIAIPVDGQQQEAYKIEMDIEGVKGLVFIDNNGRMVREEFLGFTFVKETPQKLFSKKASSSDVDLAVSFSIPTAVIPNQEGLRYLKARIGGITPESIREDFNQTRTFTENTCLVEISRKEPVMAASPPLKEGASGKYLEEDVFIKFKTPLVMDTVRSIVGAEKDAFTIIKKVSAWIHGNIEKAPSLTLPNTLDVLALKRGDCGELSALMVGFLRCAGIPSYVNIGVVHHEGRFYYHAWVSAYAGTWIDTDPALEQTVADPTHIKLLQGLENQFELFKIIPKIKMEILEYR